MKHLTLFFIAVTAFFITGCSDTPSERQIQTLLQQQFDSRYDGLVSIEDTKKLNGWQEKEQFYTAEVSYQITFNKSFKDYMDEQTALPGNPLEKMSKGMSVGMLKLQFGSFKANDVYQVKEQILQLRDTEQGWIITE